MKPEKSNSMKPEKCNLYILEYNPHILDDEDDIVGWMPMVLDYTY